MSGAANITINDLLTNESFRFVLHNLQRHLPNGRLSTLSLFGSLHSIARSTISAVCFHYDGAVFILVRDPVDTTNISGPLSELSDVYDRILSSSYGDQEAIAELVDSNTTTGVNIFRITDASSMRELTLAINSHHMTVSSDWNPGNVIVFPTAADPTAIAEMFKNFAKETSGPYTGSIAASNFAVSVDGILYSIDYSAPGSPDLITIGNVNKRFNELVMTVLGFTPATIMSASAMQPVYKTYLVSDIRALTASVDEDMVFVHKSSEAQRIILNSVRLTLGEVNAEDVNVQGFRPGRRQTITKVSYKPKDWIQGLLGVGAMYGAAKATKKGG